MTNQEIDKYLAGEMGLHPLAANFKPTENTYDYLIILIKLWAMKQEWWDEFVNWLLETPTRESGEDYAFLPRLSPYRLLDTLLSPLKGSTALATFLKERSK